MPERRRDRRSARGASRGTGAGSRSAKTFEERDRVAVEVTVVNPEWSGPVRTYKVFAFRPGEDVVVRLNDCLDESYARQVLAA